MHKIWTGSYPENQSPAIDSIRLENKSAYSNIYLKPGMEASAQIWASDVDGDEIRYEWVVMKESTDLQDGGDFETTPEPIEGIIKDATTKSITLIAPEETGPYRLFLYAYDNMGHAAHANIPFFVQ